ncbi:MAG: T9SS type A sorting domain-containing protein [Bacteroidota bacterium]
MKNFTRWVSRVTAVALFFSMFFTFRSYAQCPEPFIENHADWDWESYDCQYWQANITNVGITDTRSPFFNPPTTELFNITNQGDYTKAEGWELVKRDFGVIGQSIKFPWFILYNKYRGLLRLYFFNNSQQPFNNALVTLEHTNTEGPGLLALAEDQLDAPNAYQAYTTNDNILVAAGLPIGQSQWVVADFRMVFDPNIDIAKYTDDALFFQVYGESNSTIMLDGTSTSITSPYSFSGSRSALITDPAADAKEFVATTKKFATSVAGLPYKDATNLLASKWVDNYIEQGVPLGREGFWGKVTGQIYTGLKPSKTYFENEATVEKNLNELLGKVSSAAKLFGGAVGVVGTVIGILWPDPAKPNTPQVFAPTITRSTETISGTINTTSQLFFITLKVPGTQHTDNDPNSLDDFSDQNMPYYDCPLGVVNLKVTPQLNRITYNRFWGYEVKEEDLFMGIEYEPLTLNSSSYQGKDQLEVMVNGSSDLEIVEAQVALVATTPSANGINLGFHENLDEYPGYITWESRIQDPMLMDLEAGRLVLSDTYLTPTSSFRVKSVRTSFVDPSCYQDLSMTVPANWPVYLRLVVVMKKKGASEEDRGFVYMADYKTAMTDGGTPDNTDYQTIGSQQLTLPPFSNHTLLPQSFESDRTVTIANTDEEANKTITTQGTITMTSTALKTYRAGTRVTLSDGFTVAPGANFLATTDYGYVWNCTDYLLTELSYVCGYNIRGNREFANVRGEIEEFLNDGFYLYPNPSSGVVNLKFDAQQAGELIILNLDGKTVLRESWPQGKGSLELNTGDWKPGLYVVVLTTEEHTYRQKLIVQ